MKIKVHWIIDGIVEIDADTPAEAEKIIEDKLQNLAQENASFMTALGANAIQGRAYLPGSEDVISAIPPKAEPETDPEIN